MPKESPLRAIWIPGCGPSLEAAFGVGIVQLYDHQGRLKDDRMRRGEPEPDGLWYNFIFWLRVNLDEKSRLSGDKNVQLYYWSTAPRDRFSARANITGFLAGAS